MFSEVLRNMIRADRPESSTDAMFLVGMLVVLLLMIYATVAKTTIPHFDAMLLALCGFKTIKMGANYLSNKTSEVPKV